MNFKNFIGLLIIFNSLFAKAQNSLVYCEQYRPQLHFSPKAHWMNDPNGMVYNNGTYHLFYQYYPGATIWGPMHWGHATSNDMLHWKEQPVALFPDSIGYIFSGSTVVDKNNTSGFGKDGKAPLVAIFTQHDPKGEKAGTDTFQNQSIAYSLDNGINWIKYAHNPVIKNPGIKDFRDPKVMWYEVKKKWVMILAVKDHISIYSSKNLKDWMKESDFGETNGAHGGVWECPDLFALIDGDKVRWVLTVSVNPGAPNGGSGTQYFIGDFDGKTFTTADATTKWIDYGPDNYAGVTWSNTGNEKYFLGWMSNWNYATKVPTVKWRSAMTLPRIVSIKHVVNKMLIASEPIDALSKIETNKLSLDNVKLDKAFNLCSKTGTIKFPCRINLAFDNHKEFSIVLSNNLREQLIIGYDDVHQQFFIDRTHSGKTNFEKSFAGKHVAPRLSNKDSMNVSLIIDESSVELFADDGLSVMTEIFFPSKPYNNLLLQSTENGIKIKHLEYIRLSSIWK